MVAMAPKCKQMTRRVSGVPSQDKRGAPASLGQSGPPEILFLKRSKVGPLRAPQRFWAHYILCGYIDDNCNKKIRVLWYGFPPANGANYYTILCPDLLSHNWLIMGPQVALAIIFTEDAIEDVYIIENPFIYKILSW